MQPTQIQKGERYFNLHTQEYVLAVDVRGEYVEVEDDNGWRYMTYVGNLREVRGDE